MLSNTVSYPPSPFEFLHYVQQGSYLFFVAPKKTASQSESVNGTWHESSRETKLREVSVAQSRFGHHQQAVYLFAQALFAVHSWPFRMFSQFCTPLRNLGEYSLWFWKLKTGAPSRNLLGDKCLFSGAVVFSMSTPSANRTVLLGTREVWLQCVHIIWCR